MKAIYKIVMALGVTQAGTEFAMHDAMCPLIENGDSLGTYVVNRLDNNGGYLPGTIEAQLQTDDPSQYDLKCMQWCLAKL